MPGSGHIFFMAIRSFLIIRRTFQGLRQILLIDPGAVKIVRILIIYTVPQLGGSAVMTVPQMRRSLYGAHR